MGRKLKELDAAWKKWALHLKTCRQCQDEQPHTADPCDVGDQLAGELSSLRYHWILK